MAQLHFTVDEQTAKQLAREAKRRGMSLSRYIATLVTKRVVDSWPDGYLERVVGACEADPLELPAELPLDDVDL